RPLVHVCHILRRHVVSHLSPSTAPAGRSPSEQSVRSNDYEAFFDGNANLLCYQCPNVHILRLGFDGKGKCIACSEIAAIALWLILPPAGNRINSDHTALRQISGCADPYVGMNRPLVASHLADKPLGRGATGIWPIFILVER